MKIKCKNKIMIQGEFLEYCRTNPNHEEAGLWHRKGRTYW